MRYLLFFLTLPLFAQWTDFSTKTTSANLSGAMNSKPSIRSGAGAPALNCTTGKDLYFDTTAKVSYWCDATNHWTANATTPPDATNVTKGIVTMSTPTSSVATANDDPKLVSACSTTPPTTGPAGKTCYDTAGALWVCHPSGACTVAGDWVAQGGGASVSVPPNSVLYSPSGTDIGGNANLTFDPTSQALNYISDGTNYQAFNFVVNSVIGGSFTVYDTTSAGFYIDSVSVSTSKPSLVIQSETTSGPHQTAPIQEHEIVIDNSPGVTYDDGTPFFVFDNDYARDGGRPSSFTIVSGGNNFSGGYPSDGGRIGINDNVPSTILDIANSATVKDVTGGVVSRVSGAVGQTADLQDWGLCVTQNTCSTDDTRTITAKVTADGTFQEIPRTVDPVCTAAGDIGKFWFDNTTSTTAVKVCKAVVGSVGWSVLTTTP